MVDSAVVLQKLVLEARAVKASYLGPPEKRFLPAEPARRRLLPFAKLLFPRGAWTSRTRFGSVELLPEVRCRAELRAQR